MKTLAHIIPILIVISGCASKIEFGRRSLNEPAFPDKTEPPVLIVSSTMAAGVQIKGPSINSEYSSGRPALELSLSNPKASEIAEILRLYGPEIQKPVYANDRTVVRRTLVATVNTGDYRPGDRFVNFRLRLTPENFEFTNYAGTTTEYGRIDIMTMSVTKNDTANIGFSGGTPIATTIGASSGRSVTQTGNIFVSPQKLTTNVYHGMLEIYREADRGVDLAGNNLIDISVTGQRGMNDVQVRSDRVATEIFVIKDDIYMKPDKASIETVNLRYLVPHDLTARVDFDYVMRRVLTKSNEYAEDNQTVEYVRAHCSNPRAIIVNGRDLDIPRWMIVEIQNDKKIFAVQIDTDLGPEALAFENYHTALLFAKWMTKMRASVVGKQGLSLPGRDLSAAPYPRLVVTRSSEIQISEAPGEFCCEPEVPSTMAALNGQNMSACPKPPQTR
jgi:hypothetical protein